MIRATPKRLLTTRIPKQYKEFKYPNYNIKHNLPRLPHRQLNITGATFPSTFSNNNNNNKNKTQIQTMVSTEAQLDKLRNYTAPTYYSSSARTNEGQNTTVSVWHRVPVSRRSAVFILLFLGKKGELRVLLTKRSSKLRNFPGHVALPGGKADDALESEWQVSRREMHEEIGLSSDDESLAKLGITIEHLTLLPSYLSRTFSCVRPCVGFMKFDNNNNSSNQDETDIENTIALKLNLALNPGESSSIFSCPLRDFLYPTIDEKPMESIERVSYKVKWGGIPWDLRSYMFLQNNENEIDWLKDIKDLSQLEEDDILGSELDSEDKESVTPPSFRSRASSPKRGDSNTQVVVKKLSREPSTKQNLSSWGRLGSRKLEDTNEKVYDVWGLTANILHDLSRLIYDDRLSNKRMIVGEEDMIYALYEYGNMMQQKERSEMERKMIHLTSVDDSQNGFCEILPKEVFDRLVNIYKL